MLHASDQKGNLGSSQEKSFYHVQKIQQQVLILAVETDCELNADLVLTC